MSILNNITAAGCRRILMLAMMVLSAVFLCAFRADAAGRVSGLRIGQGIGSVRIVFDADAEFDYNVFLLDGPKRLVVDTKNVYVGKALEKTKDKNNLVGRVRVGDIHDGKTRIVFDLLKPVVVKKVFMLPPQSTFKWRLAIDVTVASEREFRQKAGIDNAYGNKSLSLAGSVQAAADATPKPRKQNARKIIVIDAGHGGHDPGAIGYSGVHEKNITLAMAKELKRQLDRKGKYTVYLTRSTDVFIPLRKRVEIARKHKADLFMSVHADSALNRKATGLSVYTLSETASDKEAAALAALSAGNVLLTTGSHTLSVYAKVIEPERLCVRVLPTHQALDLCAAAGMVQSHVIAMQGPFSRDFNAALYDQLRIRTMVSKDSGQPGGVADKVLPALERGIDEVMNDRPKEDKR